MSSRQPRTFDSLRASNGVVETGPALDTVEAAMQGIAATPDGRHLLAWLRYQAVQPAHPGATADQLRDLDGQRRAWVQLLNMAEANTPVR